MSQVTYFICIVLISLPIFARAEDGPVGWHSSGKNGAVAAGRPAAVDAGMEILQQQGGNAIDAAVATILAQSVVRSQAFCFGGEVPIIVYDAKRGVVEVLSGQGAAPQLATLQYFQQHHNGKIPGGHAASAAVPAVLHACCTALDRYGTRSFGEVARPMLRLLDRDEPTWCANLARHLEKAIEAEKKAPDRSTGINVVIDYFYRGPVARQLDQWSKENDGLIRYEDLASHQTFIEQPASANYRDLKVYKCGPWTQGPYLLQTLRLLEGYDLKSMGHNSPDYVHTVVEAMKLGLADRDAYYADPRKVDVPLEALLSDKYTDLRRQLIDPEHASLVQRVGDPLGGKALLGIQPQSYTLEKGPNRDTTTCLVADKWGNVVAATPSGWGGVLAGDTGIVLGSRLISLNTWKGHPNCVQPGKRPRITLTPTLVLQDSKPIIAVSVAGGDAQDQATLQVLLNQIEFSMDSNQAITASRFGTYHLVGSFNQPPPQLGSLTIYGPGQESTITELKTRGHKVRKRSGAYAQPITIVIDSETGMKYAAGDPRAGRHAAAY
ncbi:MAG: gamma-glutamyltransferase [Planctomycetales bacterium]